MKQRKRGCDPEAGSRWQHTLAALLEDPKLPLRKRGIRDGHLPLIVNCVATVSLMPPGCKLPLETLATHLGPCAQYAPQQFAACIFKLGDSTGLLFSSGKLLLTAALTQMHVLYACHYFRLCIESVPYRMLPFEQSSSSPIITTTFDNLATHNVVGHGHFAFTVDPERLRACYPDSIEYVSDNFPAARCKTWVYDDQRCHCGFSAAAAAKEKESLQLTVMPSAAVKHLKRKCRCIIKCLVFANGSIVMIGGKSTENVNYVFFHMKRICKNPVASSQAAPLLLRLPGAHEQRRRLEKQAEPIGPETAMTLALVAAHDFKDRTKIRGVALGDTTLLMYLADAGRLEAVRYSLALEPDQLWQQDASGKNVLQRLRQRLDAAPAVLAYLEHAAELFVATRGRSSQ